MNLQGIAIGNPSTDFDYDTGELYDAYFPTHGLQCLDSSLNGKFGFNGIIDPYDILADVCYPAAIANTIRFPNAVADKTREALALREELFGNSRNIPAMPGCIGNWVTDYLNVCSQKKNIQELFFFSNLFDIFLYSNQVFNQPFM